MGPFIPQGIINPELTLFFALVLGLGFGYVLEQAGFSSSRKLAGLFYGYDFVVLRVFFTAGITAMTGLVFFSYLGWVDMNLVYVNPTFLWSAIVGGLIMGFGFIMGGFCPGTSLVGAIIGKIDAMVFIGGMVIGMFIFGHFYETFEPLYNGSFLGNIFVYDSLGLSKQWFALLLALMALMAFFVTQIIEDKVNKIDAALIALRPSYKIPSALLAGSLLLYLFLPTEKASSIREVSPEKLHSQWLTKPPLVSAEKLAFDIMKENNQVVYIDLRSQEQYQRFTLPGSINIAPNDLLSRQYRSFFKHDPRQKVFFSDGSSLASSAWITAARAGYNHIFILDGGLNGLFAFLFEQEPTDETNNNYLYEFSTRFAKEARQFFLEGGASKTGPANPVPVKTMIEVQLPVTGGGC